MPKITPTPARINFFVWVFLFPFYVAKNLIVAPYLCIADAWENASDDRRSAFYNFGFHVKQRRNQ